MSMPVQETGTCCRIFQTVSETASTAASWLGRTAQSIGSAIGSYAQRVAEFARPHFERMREFVSENRGPIIIAVVAAAVGAIIYGVFGAIFCSEAEPQPTPAPNPA